MTSKDPGLAALETISAKIKNDYDTPEDAEWDGHPLSWIRSQPSARIGKIGRVFVQALCQAAGLRTKPIRYSLNIADKVFQVRFSTGWSGGGFKFEQLRFEKYEAVVCLGMTPKRAFAWVVPRSAIFGASGTILKKDGLTSQHKGKGGSETAWINVDVSSIPAWMAQYGDSIAEAIANIKANL